MTLPIYLKLVHILIPTQKTLVCSILIKYVFLFLKQLTKYKIPKSPLHLYLTRSVHNVVTEFELTETCFITFITWSPKFILVLMRLISIFLHAAETCWSGICASHAFIIWVNWWEFLVDVTRVHISLTVLFSVLFTALGRFYVQNNKTTSQSQKQYHINVAPYSLKQNVLTQLVLA